ncbi:MAG: cobyrinate a,c-diamide synthase [Selenomonadaceae bacterium]|nr:cobyrinate a,c-diamide synthase [Selenomonadaceae bacterium]
MKKIFPRIVIAATQSGSGKTTIVSGIAAALKNRGLKVQTYKVGPDYIDPGFHEISSGRTSHNLDSWLVGEKKIADIFLSTFNDADIAIIEGVMGLFDGGRGGISSTAEISKILNAPVVLVIDAKSMGTSAAAVALGFKNFDKTVNFAGVILNRIGSESHKKIICDALNEINIKCFGAIKRDENFILPERHLGLVPTAENNFSEVIEKISDAVENQIDLDALINLAKNSAPLPDKKNSSFLITHSKLFRVAVAKDEAFNFYYAESLRELENFGAEIIFFSPLHDKNLPKNIDGLILGGGFPEIFAEKLEENKSMRDSIKNFAENNFPIFAECGGYMYLMKSIKNFDGKIFEMCGVIPNRAEMTKKLQMVGYVEAALKKNCILGKIGDKIHAHEFHFSVEKENLSDEKIFDCQKLRTGEKYSAGYFDKNIFASYLHIHFAGCMKAAESFVNACKKLKEEKFYENCNF